MRVVVQLSTRLEWQAILDNLPATPALAEAPVGSFAHYRLNGAAGEVQLTLLHGGVGKVRAAASAQYAILAWQPDLLALLGTAGAVDPALAELDLILAQRTVIYDFVPMEEQVSTTLIANHTVELAGPWDERAFPFPTRRGVLVTGDGDVTQLNVRVLRERFAALAADWESGAVAKVCELNRMPCLVLRGITDTPTVPLAEQFARYQANTPAVMERLWRTLGVCLDQAARAHTEWAGKRS